MTKDEIAVLGHAFFDGKTLQRNHGDGFNDWLEVYCPNFTHTTTEWRIKPEEKKKEIWCTFKGREGNTLTSVKDSERYQMYLNDSYLTHIPSLDKEVELP